MPNSIQYALLSSTFSFTCLIMAGCGDAELGSRFLSSTLVSPESGGELVVLVEESQTLANTRLQVPAGAVDESVRIFVTPSEDLELADGDLTAGPAANFGPDGLSFNTPASLTLPLYALPQGGDVVRVLVEEADGSRSVIEGDDVVVDATEGTVTVPVAHFTRFQPATGQPPACRSNADCLSNESCVQGLCLPNSGGCRTSADCAMGQICAQGICNTPPATCTSNADCPTGEQCTNGVCVVPAPNSCTVDGDCPSGQICASGTCQVAPACAIALTPSSLSFNPTPMGATAKLNLFVRSRGTTAPVVNRVANLISGSPFSVTTALPATSSVSNATVLEVEFAPFSPNRVEDLLTVFSDNCPTGETVQLLGPVLAAPMCMRDADCSPGQRCLQGVCL